MKEEEEKGFRPNVQMEFLFFSAKIVVSIF